MTLRNGKFYDDAGNVVPLEIGNKDQIKCLQHYEKQLAELKEGVMICFEPIPEERGCKMYSFARCLCGDQVLWEQVAIDEVTCYSLIDGLRRTCSCGRKYGVDLHESDGYYVLKLISEPKKTK